MAPTARVYIDGFNLYYGALKGTPYKWLDLDAWSGRMLPTYVVGRITYCTARVRAQPHKPETVVRQEVYLRALGTLKSVDIIEGQFKVNDTEMPRRPATRCACCQSTPPGCWCCRGPLVPVTKTEEKGSDVNVAVRLVSDGFRQLYDVALVVSGDSDIQPAIDIVRQELGKKVIVADPRNRRFRPLIGDEVRVVRKSGLAASQFAAVLHDERGRITKPRGW